MFIAIMMWLLGSIILGLFFKLLFRDIGLTLNIFLSLLIVFIFLVSTVLLNH